MPPGGGLQDSMRDVGRFAEQGDRRGVMRPVGERHAAYPRHGGALMLVVRQAGGAQQPAAR